MNKGFTLVEVLVAIAIIGILAGLGLPFYLNRIKQARYSEAVQIMGAIATELKVYRAENERYPEDEIRNTRPQGVSFFPVTPEDETPFGAAFDYDNYRIGGICWVQVVFLGENGGREVSQSAFQGELGAIATVGDDRILVVTIDECDRSSPVFEN